MRRILIFCSGLFCFGTAFAQMALLDKAHELIGRNELGKAWNALEIADKNSITANEPRTFYLKAYIGKEMFVKSHGKERDSIRIETFRLLETCAQLDKAKAYSKQRKQIFDFALASIFNDGSEQFNAGNFDHALLFLNDFISRKDVQDEHWMNAVYFSAVSYAQTRNHDEAIKLFETLRQKSYDQPLLYLDLADLYSQRTQEETSLVVLAEGLTRYPGNFEMEIAEINTLSHLQRLDTLEQKLEIFLTKYPDNVDVLLMAGTVFEKRMRDSANDSVYSQKAEHVYNTVLQHDPENFNGNYNLGALYYNRAVELINKQDYDIDISELTIVLERSMQMFHNALPYMLKIRDVKQNQLQVLRALQAIYYNLNMKAELAEVNTRLAESGK